MKRFAILALILLLFFSLALPVYADAPGEMPPDSLTIDDATREKFQLQPGETIFRIYDWGDFSAFAKKDNITDVLDSLNAKVYYAICSADGQYRGVNEQNEPINSAGRSPETDMAIFRAADDAIYKVSPDIVVYYTYYLSGIYSMGKAIYYVTDRGDYVFFRTYSSAGYLFPIDAFCKLQKDSIEWSSMGLPAANIDMLWDLSGFDINSESFDINAAYPPRTVFFGTLLIIKYTLITIFVAGGVYLVVTAVVRYRKRKKTDKIDELLA